MNLYTTQYKVLRTLDTCRTDPQREAAIRYAKRWIDILIDADMRMNCDVLIDCAAEVAGRIKSYQQPSES